MHELKAGLSRFMAQAHAGAVIEVTSHDKPIARIVGIPAAEQSGLTHLMARGAAQWSGGKPSLQPAVKLEGDGKTLSATVLEDRG